MTEPSALERLALLEAERDALRERLASFERGDRDRAHRAERAELEAQAELLEEENRDLRRQIAEEKKKDRFGHFSVTQWIEGLFQRLIGGRR